MRIFPRERSLHCMSFYSFCNAVVKLPCYPESVWMHSMELLLQNSKEWIFVVWIWIVLPLVMNLTLLWRYFLIISWCFNLRIFDVSLFEMVINLLPDGSFKLFFGFYNCQNLEPLTEPRKINIFWDEYFSSIRKLPELIINQIHDWTLVIVIYKLMQ